MPAIDLVVWNNSFNLVNAGISLNYNSASPSFGRAVILDNGFTLPRNTSATAIAIKGISTGQYFDQTVVRNNQIAAELTSGLTTSLSGIRIANVSVINVENNVIKDYGTSPGAAFGVQYCPTVRAFNNLDGTGQLIRAYDMGLTHTLQELEDYIEDSFLGI